jgi:phage terminase large subunit GpA-like protein
MPRKPDPDKPKKFADPRAVPNPIDPKTGKPRRGRPRTRATSEIVQHTAPAPKDLPDDFFSVPLPESVVAALKGELKVGETLSPPGLETDRPQEMLDEQERRDTDREQRRAGLAADIARRRWNLAFSGVHRLESGEQLDFDSHPFQIAIYQDPCPDLVLFGSVQWGKSELLICHIMAAAASGQKVMFVCSKQEARERLVKTRIDPPLRKVPQYRRLIARAEAMGRKTDSQQIKHIGDGSIVFVNSRSKDDFYGQPVDTLVIDEHQLCDLNNLNLAHNRLAGSPWQFVVIAGNPLLKGNADNQNLHYQFMESDQRQWYVPCPWCESPQILDWEANVVKVDRNKAGAIVGAAPQDPDWDPAGPLDMRPLCVEKSCRRPMDRLTDKGFWKPSNPGHRRHGFQLSNLYNANTPLWKLFKQYKDSYNSPMRLANFEQNQLGRPFEQEGNSITEAMIAACATGADLGLSPYRVIPADGIEWREQDAA